MEGDAINYCECGNDTWYWMDHADAILKCTECGNERTLATADW